ncbi:MAG: hypothetical protein ABIY70_08185 [Capsulimonas sp.]|uniref:hypothetical protein n=1 Tax=Capsulimonas sp. TaxID=2494211 RepID=UPI0032666E85
MTANPNKTRRRRIVLISLLVAAIVLTIGVFWRQSVMSAELAPGAANAIRRALGDGGVRRVVQVISPGNQDSAASAGTHKSSGEIDGRPYGLAFDIMIQPGQDPDADTRALRLQGIAAWRRGPGAPGGPAGLGPHIHCVWPGAPTSNIQNVEQISSFVHGYRGLADAARPRAQWIDPSIQDDERAKIREVYEQVNGAGSLKTADTYDALHRGRSGG